jgi:cell cycle checkpoint protein
MTSNSSNCGTPDHEVEDRKRRKQRRPPQRLSWPGTLSQSSNVSTVKSSFTQQSLNQSHEPVEKGGRHHRKRARITAAPPLTTPTTSTTDNNGSNMVMWVDKYIPLSTSDLCVAPKKVKEIIAWLEAAQKSIHSRHNSKTTSNQQQQQLHPKLLILVGSPGIGKSTTVRVIAKELHLNILSWNESFLPRSTTSPGMNSRSVFTLEQTSPLDSFAEFLQQSGCGISSLHLSTSSSSSIRTDHTTTGVGPYDKSIILLEDLPNLHGQDAELQFRTLLSRHVRHSFVPTVLIFSDVTEGKHRPDDLERLIDPEDLYSMDRTTIMQLHSITKPKMKKILSDISKQQKCLFSSNFLEEIHLQSHGDMRQALMTLQLHASGLSTRSLDDQHSRDTKLSSFHSLGKLLYAKRTLVAEGRLGLAFDPEDILERSDLGVAGSLRFLECHSSDFFMEIADLSRAYDYFSDASVLLSYQSGTNSSDERNSTIFPFACASSIAGRAVANTNFHPAPNKFRQFSKPKVFDAIWKGRQNQVLVDKLSRKLSINHCLLAPSTIANYGSFVTESLPYMRRIVPNEIDSFIDNFYSMANDEYMIGKKKLESMMQTKDVSLQDEEEILGLDDIDEYDSDDDDDDEDDNHNKIGKVIIP